MMNSYELAKNIATTLIRGTNAEGQALTRELIEQHVDAALRLNPVWLTEVDRAALVKELETQCAVWMGTAQILDNASGHEPWLPAKRGKIEWKYWQRYRSSLSWPFKSVDRLDELTDQVLERLEDPAREGHWNRRGLVVGHVQSGKTANYIGLINKAVDAGYKLIVVLAGIHKSLRSQTQIRLDEGFLGYESTPNAKKGPIGVGMIDPSFRPNTITTRLDDGDFKRSVAKNFAIDPGTTPLLFVVKKNSSVLKNLVEWVEWAGNAKDENGRKFVKGVPLLVIDDEADHASVDTKEQAFNENGEPDEEHDPTIINRRIRKLLRCFEKSAYVGYTATPFANIFIHESGATSEEGKDLFPESFIVNLPTPTDYVGPLRVFGMDADEQANLEASAPLPVVRTIDDYATPPAGNEGQNDESAWTGWMPPRHKKTHVPASMPASLEEAIKAFVIVCAARRARGQLRVHNSMLIHVTRFTDVQGKVKEQVDDYLKALKRRIKHGEGEATNAERESMRRLWEDDFVPTTVAIDGKSDLTWQQVDEELWDAVSAIEMRCVNGTAKDILDYEAAKETGISLIAVGGDKLARGLTLEGLSVSYFLRASKMYDTLMQMGRWFGYRPGYLDLCRLYMTDELNDWFRHITAANEELRQEFDRMASVGGTPRDYGLRVKSHPALLVTSPVKMRSGVELDISFAGTMKESVTFSLKDAAHNFQSMTKFVEQLGEPVERHQQLRPGGKVAEWKGTRLWTHVDASVVCSFLDSLKTHPRARDVKAKLLADFVRASRARGELTEWHVALVGRESGTGEIMIAGKPHLLVERNGQTHATDPDNFYFKRVVNPRDESIDIDGVAYEEALHATKKQRIEKTGKAEVPEPSAPNGPSLRSLRPATRGLLLLYPFPPTIISTESPTRTASDRPRAAPPTDVPLVGFALSFPTESSGATVKYKVNNVYWQQEFGGES